MAAFKRGNYEQYIESKLRSRKQMATESPIEYFYDVMALCKILDPNMSEWVKVNYLMGGINADLTEYLYPKKIDTTDKFLKEAKLIDEAKAIARGKQESYSTAEKGLAVIGEDVDASDTEYETNDREKERELERLEEEIAQLIAKRNKIRRDMDMEEIHDDVMGLFAIAGSEKELLVVSLKVNGIQDVATCVDTGATASAITPRLVEKMRLRPLEMHGDCVIRLLNGQLSRPLGMVYVEVESANGRKARGKANVMELPGLPNLLLGNDFLQQFQKMTIDYNEAGPVVTLGQLKAEKRSYPRGTTVRDDVQEDRDQEKEELKKMNAEIDEAIRKRNALRKVIGALGGGKRSRQKKGWDDQGRPICHICKETGHLMRDCDSREGRPLRRARREDEDMGIRTTSTMEKRGEQTESEPAQTEESRQLGISPPPKEDKCEEIGFPDELLLSAEEEWD